MRKIKDILADAGAATAGPWFVPRVFHFPLKGDYADDVVAIVSLAEGLEDHQRDVIFHLYYDGHHLIARPADTRFIALARTDVPEMAAEILRLRALVGEDEE